MKKYNFAIWVYFCVYPVFHWDDIVKKILPKVGVGAEKILFSPMEVAW